VVSGEIREITRNGTKTKAEKADPANKTGITALWFNAVFLKISWNPRKNEESMPRMIHMEAKDSMNLRI
jgi:hypothetical protein